MEPQPRDLCAKIVGESPLSEAQREAADVSDSIFRREKVMHAMHLQPGGEDYRQPRDTAHMHQVRGFRGPGAQMIAVPVEVGVPDAA
jgi:hypothetical protein